MSHVFLSYSSRDAATAERLAGILESQGLSVWWDRSIPPGKTFDQVIEEALEAAAWVVVLWSSHSVESNWVKAEAGEALRRGVLVPVLIEKVRSPLAFRRIEAAELQDWDGDTSDPEFQQLMRVLEGETPPPAPTSGGEPRRPVPPRPPQPKGGGLSSRAKLGIGLAVAFLALVGVGIGVVAMVGRQITEGRQPVPNELGPVPQEQPSAGNEKLQVRPDSGGGEEPADPIRPPAGSQRARVVPKPSAEEVRTPTPATTGNIILQYLGDEYGCILDLTIRVGNQSFVPTGNILPVNGISLGASQYAVSGTIGCPYFGSCAAMGSGTLDVYDGAIYNLMWQNNNVGQCQIHFVDAAYN